MNIAFRADASVQISTGHVMRCLTLAEALKERGGECLFVCREHPGNMIETIRQRGFSVAVLPCREDVGQRAWEVEDPLPPHSSWLGCDWHADARLCSEILSGFKTDWLVVDHYALDYRWEVATKRYALRILAIDDVADRVHSCDLLLDQNLGRRKADYQNLVPQHCRLMIGPKYALLRPEFSRLREYNLKRRENSKLRQLLISMGGVDKDNATGVVLEALKGSRLPDDCRIDVVMGANAPWLTKVQDVAVQMPWPTEISVNVSDMAQRMADADLAIGAAGGTSWERCCLGLPAVLIVLADNQVNGARALEAVGAAVTIADSDSVQSALPSTLEEVSKPEALWAMSQAAAAVTDGRGASSVVAAMMAMSGGSNVNA